MNRSTLAFGLVLTLGLATQVRAGIITFEHDATGSISGALGGVPFTSANIVLTSVGDNDNRVNFGSGWYIDHDFASIDIAGVGTFDFITGTRTFVNNNANLVGWSRAGISGADLLNGPVDAAFGPWDMLSSIGPITGSGSTLQWTAGDILTTGGILDINSSTLAITFTATKLPAPWTDQGCALPGVFGDPLLVGSGTLAGGSSNSVDLSNAAPSATAGLFIALSSNPVPFKGGTLKPFPFLELLVLTTDGTGAISIPFTIAAGIPAGTELWLQWAIQDATAIAGVSLSNALRGVTP